MKIPKLISALAKSPLTWGCCSAAAAMMIAANASSKNRVLIVSGNAPVMPNFTSESGVTEDLDADGKDSTPILADHKGSADPILVDSKTGNPTLDADGKDSSPILASEKNSTVFLDVDKKQNPVLGGDVDKKKNPVLGVEW